jgi:hypothetical protein
MSVAAAPAALVFRRRSTLEPVSLDPSLEIGAGGEARVLAVPGDRWLVAKLYHHPTVERARKVALMIAEPPRIDDPRAALAWPVDLLLGERGTFAGFLMPRAEGPRLFELYNPVTRRKSGELCDHAMLHRAGTHLAAAFDALHARGYVVGDVNESNVLLGPGGGVTLVDTDSFQVRDPEDGAVHRSGVGKTEFTPPELQGRPFAEFDRTPEHDRFGLGVLLFLTLMEGTHPFAGRMELRAETPPIEERIRRGLFAHHGHPEIHPPRLAPPFAVLDAEVRTLFVRCFVGGHANPSLRPTAAQWRAVLAAAEARMVTCGRNPRHRFGAHLDGCPWCERAALLRGRDPFPADPSAGRRDGIRPRRKVYSLLKSFVVTPAAPPPAVAVPAVIPPRTASPAATNSAATSTISPSPVSTSTTSTSTTLAAPVPAAPAKKAKGVIGWTSGIAAIFLPLLLALAGPGGIVAAVAIFMVMMVIWLTRRARADTMTPLPIATLPAPAVLPPLPVVTPDTFRLRIAASKVTSLDSAPVLDNRDDLERLLEPCRPPLAMHPAQWAMRVALWVREDGTPEPAHLHVLDSPPPGPAVDAVLQAVPLARFQPLLRHGEPASAWVWLDVTFGR